MKTPPKRSTAAARKAADQQPSKDDHMVILVRRGALRRFDALTQKTTELPVIISWDRRQNERRRTAAAGTVERRRVDRRQAAPFTWELADFVVLPGGTFETNDASANTPEPPATATPHSRRPRAGTHTPALKAVRRNTSRTKK
jgi:hypothetical protein